MTTIRCACGDHNCPTKVWVDGDNHLWMTGKDNQDSLMYLDSHTRIELLRALIDDVLGHNVPPDWTAQNFTLRILEQLGTMAIDKKPSLIALISMFRAIEIIAKQAKEVGRTWLP